jgi:adenylate cyclase
VGEHSRLDELQVVIVARLGRSLDVELTRAEALRAMRERPSNPDAADLEMQADSNLNLPPSKANLNDAVTLSERALALDPQSEYAMVDLAEALVSRALDRWSDDPAGDIASAEKTVDSGLALQPEDPWAHFTKGHVYFANRQLGPANTEFETAIALDPNNANAHAYIGFLKVYRGPAADGFAEVETAFRLNPRDPSGALVAILFVRLAQPSRAVGAGHSMLREVDRGDPSGFLSLRRTRRRLRLGRARQGGERDRCPIAKSSAQLNRAGLGRKTHER